MVQGRKFPLVGGAFPALDMQSRRRYTHIARLTHGYVTGHSHTPDTSVRQPDR